MSDLTLMLLIALAGLGTYLMRLLPMRYGQRLAGARGPVALFLGALGVAAITALIVVSMAGLWLPEATAGEAARLAGASLAVLVVLRLAGNVGLATLAGALAYGLLGAL